LIKENPMTDPYTQPVPEATPQTSTVESPVPIVIPADAQIPQAPDEPSIHPAEPTFDDNGNISAAPEVVPFGTPITTEQEDGSTFFSRTYVVPSLDHDIENLRDAFKVDVGAGFTFTSIRVDVDASYGDVEETDEGLVSAPTYTAVVTGTGRKVEAPVPFTP
jgi:hypothetical protein